MMLLTFGSEPGHMMTFNQLEQLVLTGGAVSRLLMASLLGGVVGIDREIHHKASGIRTNLLLCFGCALFTFLSAVLAGEGNPDKGRVASNIVQGIGFLGAGLILHDQKRIRGLTSAATVFVVASIGMACGAGLYFPAILATVVVLFAMETVGMMERKFNLKVLSAVYEVRGQDSASMRRAVLQAMDRTHHRLTDVEEDVLGDLHRISFPVAATNKQHLELKQFLHGQPAIETVLSFHDPEDE